MIRKRPDSGWRASAFAVALFAITLNFLQPMAHAAMLRDAGPLAAAKMWGAFCLPSTGQDDSPSSTPAETQNHECCLGLAHAPVLAEPSAVFIRIEPVVTTTRFVAAVDAYAPVGIRDGPSQPRAPPSLA
ncbi:MAG: hypothetical protein LCH93_11395 [Proteobacteria bacterium]|nr:hypothetical protein [Pseudomonadota bacterium]